MGKDDWFRKTTWTEADQAEFWAKLKRSRTAYNKAQYLRIQASYLSGQYPATALEMLDKMLREFPDSPEVSGAELQRGQIFLGEGKLEAALEALERALAREEDYPNMQTDAWSVYGKVVVQNKVVPRYERAGKLAAARLRRAVFPTERYLANAILAVIEEYRGRSDAAVAHARAALAETKVEHSGFRYHPDVGLVTNPDEQLVAELRRISAL
jgi:tetratricopeptide (TPR) repeat protein